MLIRKKQIGNQKRQIHLLKAIVVTTLIDKIKKVQNLYYSDTPCDTLNGPYKQLLNHPKNVIIEHLNINTIRNKFSCFKNLVLKETDICLLSETKLDDSFPNFQCFEKIKTKMVAVLYYT